VTPRLCEEHGWKQIDYAKRISIAGQSSSSGFSVEADDVMVWLVHLSACIRAENAFAITIRTATISVRSVRALFLDGPLAGAGGLHNHNRHRAHSRVFARYIIRAINRHVYKHNRRAPPLIPRTSARAISRADRRDLSSSRSSRLPGPLTAITWRVG